MDKMNTFYRGGFPRVDVLWSTLNSSLNMSMRSTHQLTCQFQRKRRRSIVKVSPPSKFSLSPSLSPSSSPSPPSPPPPPPLPSFYSLIFSPSHPLPPLSHPPPCSVDYNLDQAESDTLLLELLDIHDDMHIEVDKENQKNRSENRHPSLFGLYPLPNREEAKENRLPAPPPSESQGLKLHVKVSELR